VPDQDKDLVHLFVRDLDEIELPPRDRWRLAPRKESLVMKTSRYVLYATAIAAVLVVALIASFALRGGNQVATRPSPTIAAITTSPTPTPTAATASPTPTAGPAGAITGALSYPSEFIPPLTVYAVSVADQNVLFSVDTPRFGADPSVQPTAGPPGPRPSYTIAGVTPGAYYVFAFRRDTFVGNDIPAVYSRFVVDCMQPYEGAQKPIPSSCPNDHTLVQVTVRPGETASRIDVTDWNCSLPGSTCPPRPR